MNTLAFALALLAMVVGVIGTLLPAVPGLPLIWLAMGGFALVDRFRSVTPAFLAITFVIVLLTQVCEQYARAWGARRFGAGRAGTWGAVIGAIAGLFFMPIGLVLGPFLGAMVGELLVGRAPGEALRAGWGGLVGVLGSVFVNFLVAMSLAVAFVVKVIF